VDLVIRADRAVMLMTECTGLWRRTLLIDSDGSQDIGTGVAWLQGITAFVDTRGFAGRLNQHGDVFEWQRLIDIEPPGPFPDAGRMRWEVSVLIEVGVHQDYVEHWVRHAGPAAPCWALACRTRFSCASARNSDGRTEAVWCSTRSAVRSGPPSIRT
jgi:hypothetical protein